MRRRAPVLAAILILSAAITGCAYTNDLPGETHDPWESFNRDAFSMNVGLDQAVMQPISSTYTKVLPSWTREAVFNFFKNAAYPKVIVNQFLQGKLIDGLNDIGRFVINSTFGLGGLIDFAGGLEDEDGRASFPEHEEDFDQTLATWGVPSGPYMELPFIGPRSVRAALMIIPDGYFNVTTLAYDTTANIALFGVETVNDRARVEGAIRLRDETALDPYVFQREGYLQRRRSLIFDGNPPLEDFDLEEGEGESTTQ